MRTNNKRNIGRFMAQYGLYAGAAGAWLAYVGDLPLRLGIATGLALVLLAGLSHRVLAARQRRAPQWADLL
jgi:hypothetical protein